MNTIGSDVRRRIDAHLDAIDRVLAAQEMTRAERRNVTDDVETQILDILAERAPGDPTVADIDAILAELDPPEAYGELNAGQASDHAEPIAITVSTSLQDLGPACFSRPAITGAIWALLGIVFIVVAATTNGGYPNAVGLREPLLLYPLRLVALISIVAPIGATIFAFLRFRRSVIHEDDDTGYRWRFSMPFCFPCCSSMG